MNNDPTEKPAGEATRCLDGTVHVYHSSEGDHWARLCMIADKRADVLLSPEQAATVASAMEEPQQEFLCVAKGMLWFQRRSAAPFLAVLGVECAFDNKGAEVRVTAEHLRQIAAALRAASSLPPTARGGPDGARRRTDDNLRRVFG